MPLRAGKDSWLVRSKEETSMTPLRWKMIDDMQAAGLAAETQTVYLRAVAALAAYYRRAPDQLSEVEARAIIGRVRSPVQKTAMLLMYACGLRITEAATLEVTAIDGINGFIRVIGKGNKERQVPLPKPVLTQLRTLWKTHRDKRWLFPSPRQEGPISRYALWLTFKQAVQAAGITRWITPHSLRHSYG